MTTLAGTAGVDSDGNPLVGYLDATGNSARFYYPSAIALDAATNLYIADTFNGAIRKVTPARVVSTLPGAPQFGTDGFIPAGGSADGIGSAARFFRPAGIAVDNGTNVYVADTYNHTLRNVSPAGVVSTIAGVAGLAGSTDGLANLARFNYPSGLVLDSVGNLYIPDSANNTIRKMTPGGLVTTLGGMPTISGSADGRGAKARCYNPSGLALDSAGNIYVADYYLNTIRKGTPPLMLLNSQQDSTGSFGFISVAIGAQSVIIEASTEFINWQAIWTNNIPSDVKFADPNGAFYPHRFYRARVQ